MRQGEYCKALKKFVCIKTFVEQSEKMKRARMYFNLARQLLHPGTSRAALREMQTNRLEYDSAGVKKDSDKNAASTMTLQSLLLSRTEIAQDAGSLSVISSGTDEKTQSQSSNSTKEELDRVDVLLRRHFCQRQTLFADHNTTAAGVEKIHSTRKRSEGSSDTDESSSRDCAASSFSTPTPTTSSSSASPDSASNGATNTKPSSLIPLTFYEYCCTHFGSPVPVHPSYPLFIVYTSGSTGPPKPIVHTHGSLLMGVCASMNEIFAEKTNDNDLCSSEVLDTRAKNIVEAGATSSGTETVENEGRAVTAPGASTTATVVRTHSARKFRDNDKFLVLATPAWITGQSYMITGALAMGIPSVLLEGSPTTPSPTRFAEVIQRNGVTLFKAGSTFLRGVMADFFQRKKKTQEGDAVPCPDGGTTALEGVLEQEPKEQEETSQEPCCKSTSRRPALSLKQMCQTLRAGVFCAEPVSPVVHEFAVENLCANYRNCYWGTEHGSIVFASPEVVTPGEVGMRPLPWVAVQHPKRSMGANFPACRCSSDDQDRSSTAPDQEAGVAGRVPVDAERKSAPRQPQEPITDALVEQEHEAAATNVVDLRLDLSDRGIPFPSLAQTVWGDLKGFELQPGDIEEQRSTAYGRAFPTVVLSQKIVNRWRGNLRLWKQTYFPELWAREERETKLRRGGAAVAGGSGFGTTGDRGHHSRCSAPTEDVGENNNEPQSSTPSSSSSFCRKDPVEEPPVVSFVQGDSVYYDETADLYYFRGRSDDVLNVGGVRVGTGEIESALLQKQKSAKLCVAAAPDKLAGQVPVVFYERNKNSAAGNSMSESQQSLDFSALREAVRVYVGSAAVPRYFIPLNQLPSTITGKFTRGLLKKMLEDVEYQPASVATLQNAASVLQDLRRAIKKHFLLMDVNEEEDEVDRHDPGRVHQKRASEKEKDADEAGDHFLVFESDDLHRLLQDQGYAQSVPLIQLGLDSMDLTRLRDSLAQNYDIRFPNTFGAGVNSLQSQTLEQLRELADQSLEKQGLRKRILANSWSPVATGAAGDHQAQTEKSEGPLSQSTTADVCALHLNTSCKKSSATQRDSTLPPARNDAVATLPAHARERDLPEYDVEDPNKKYFFCKKQQRNIPILQYTTKFGGLKACKVGDLKHVVNLLMDADQKLLKHLEEGSRKTQEHWDPRFYRCRNDSNALHWACTSGNLTLVKLLLDWIFLQDSKDNHGKNLGDTVLNHKNKEGRTPVMFACKYGHLEVVKYLYTLAEEERKREKAGKMHLFRNSVRGTFQLSPEPLEPAVIHHLRIANFEVESNDGSNAFDWAMYSGNLDLITYLCDMRPDALLRRNKFGCAAVHWAASGGRVPVLQWLARVGEAEGKARNNAYVDIFNDAGHSAVSKAAWFGHRGALEFLLLGEEEEVSPTAAHAATATDALAQKCSPAVRRLNLKWQLAVPDATGLTPIDLARMGQHPELATWLQGLPIPDVEWSYQEAVDAGSGDMKKTVVITSIRDV
ncbi:unnamed protein product [Amoebophrya sp. A120]|nr:unnamed protein product [Amoebophrya sp. A120]|eukprot:GSA120T00005784001.1